MSAERPRILVVTGTDTGVGKTVATAAVAARAAERGERVLVVKPVQTGIGGQNAPVEPADVDVVAHLTGCPVLELVRLGAPLAPDTAARLEGVALPSVAEHAQRLAAVATDVDLVLVEGAGGLLVRLDADGGTLLDLVFELRELLLRGGVDGIGEDGAGHHTVDPDAVDPDAGVGVLVVCRAGLGTLNHTALTVGALRAAGIEPAGLVIGAWPEHPDLAQRCNLDDLVRVTGVPLAGVLPDGAGRLEPADFRASAASWLTGR